MKKMLTFWGMYLIFLILNISMYDISTMVEKLLMMILSCIMAIGGTMFIKDEKKIMKQYCIK